MHIGQACRACLLCNDHGAAMVFSVLSIGDRRHDPLRSLCLLSPSLSHSFNFDQRRLPDTFLTAIATAFFCPTSTTSRLPRVTPV
jgi:hypothetical protein